MSCDVGEVTERLENELCWLARWIKWRACDIGEAKEGLKNELWRSSFSKLSVASPTPQLILQPFPRFTYLTDHSPALPLLHLCYSSFSNRSFASPTSQDFHLHHQASRPWWGAKDDWDFRISDLVKSWWNWYLTPNLVNFGEVRKAHLAKSILLTSTSGPLGSFQIF